jgi:hypothetical protein
LAERLFFLGCTVPGGRPLETCGTIEIVYRSGPPDRYPLMLGYTLDVANKLLSTSKAIYLHPSGDVFQHYLVLAPRPEVVEKIVLRHRGEGSALPQITAITCQTPAAGERLAPLPDCPMSAEEQAWIEAHTLTPTSPKKDWVEAEIRRAHKLK